MKLSIPEILDQVSAATGKAEKISTLQKLNNTTLQQILRLNFDPNVELDLPAGPAPYNARRDIPVELSESNLYNEARRLYIFEPGHPKYNPNVKKTQKENIWIQILEGCHHTEADLLNLVKDKKLSSAYKGLTEALVREAFPGLLSEKVSKK
jgi:hypothetical protein